MSAIVVGANGPIATASVPVQVALHDRRLLTAQPTMGIAPLSVTFSLIAEGMIRRVELDAHGDGRADLAGAALEGFQATYTRPGIYVATATIAEPGGTITMAHAVVRVFDRAALDGLLQDRWRRMKEALRQNKIEAALDSVAYTERAGYREMFVGLGANRQKVDTILGDISLVEVDDRRIEYQMIRVENGVRLSYLVLFVQDADGVWRLQSF